MFYSLFYSVLFSLSFYRINSLPNHDNPNEVSGNGFYIPLVAPNEIIAVTKSFLSSDNTQKIALEDVISESTFTGCARYNFAAKVKIGGQGVSQHIQSLRQFVQCDCDLDSIFVSSLGFFLANGRLSANIQINLYFC